MAQLRIWDVVTQYYVALKGRANAAYMHIFDLEAGIMPSEKDKSSIIFQGSNVAVGNSTFVTSLTGIDMATATLIVAVTEAATGTVAVSGQVSFDGATNPAPDTAVSLLAASGAGVYAIGLKDTLISGSNPIYGPYFHGTITVATSTVDAITMYLLAQGK